MQKKLVMPGRELRQFQRAGHESELFGNSGNEVTSEKRGSGLKVRHPGDPPPGRSANPAGGGGSEVNVAFLGGRGYDINVELCGWHGRREPEGFFRRGLE